MSRRRFSAAPDNTEIDTSPKLPPQPTMMPPTYHIDDLAEPMKHITRPLEKMAMCNPPNDSNTDDDGKPQDVPQAISKVASRVTGTEDALAELVRVAFIHTNMLKNLQTANAALSEQLKSTTMRLNQMEVEFRALRDAKAIDFMPKHLVNVNEAIINGRLVDDHHHNFHNPFTRNTGPKTECFQWTDMSSLAATLAVAPQVPGSASSAFSRSSNSDYRERRPFKPHREEHVKRSRITYDRNGGQTPNIPPPDTANENPKLTMNLPVASSNTSSTQSFYESVSSGENSEEDAECDGPGEPSLTSWLYRQATRALFRQ